MALLKRSDRPNRSGRGNRLRAAALGGLLLAAVALPAHGAEPRSLAPGTAFTPLTGSLLTTPAPFEGADSKIHLSYELITTNAVGSAPVRLDRLEIRDAQSRRVLAALDPAALAGAANPVGGPSPATEDGPAARGGRATATVLAGSSQWIVWIDFTLDPADPVPTAIEHHLDGTLLLPAGDRPFEETITRTDLAHRPPPTLAAPVPAGTWYASEGCCDNTHHRRGLAPINGVLDVPQRFAIDWFRVGADQQTWQGDPGRLESYLSFRQPVLAAARARVVEVQDGLPDNPPPVPPTIPPIEDTVGNHLTLEVAPGEYLLYAHLEAGSLTVHEGDCVEPGQQLALIGNSGNSTTPHLHFQVMTTREFFPTDSPPYTFRSFEVTGQVVPRIWDDNLGLQPTGVLPVSPSPYAGHHHAQLPLDRNIVVF
ncbi:M23 family metallopeptidase [Kitasatospora nipponensis]|uniref:M23 family metallopeptidase n=1 Tax=Kitasatospora nipponensis TaxID=258049 RepID=A0ABN1VNM5_9ACTN